MEAPLIKAGPRGKSRTHRWKRHHKLQRHHRKMNEIKSKRFKHPKESSTIFQPQLQDFFNFKSKSQFNPIFRVSRIFNNQIEELWRIQESPLATWNTTKKVHPPWCPPPFFSLPRCLYSQLTNKRTSNESSSFNRYFRTFPSFIEYSPP